MKHNSDRDDDIEQPLSNGPNSCREIDQHDSLQVENASRLFAVDSIFRRLFQQINTPIIVIAPQTGNILVANKAACDFYGYSLSELTNRKIYDLAVLPPEEAFCESPKNSKG